jgi:membrane-bound serine protease (ClpP class)
MPARHARLKSLRQALHALLLIVCALMLGAQDSAPAPAPPPASPMAPAAASAVPAYRQANQVAVLTVHGVIDGVTLKSLERRIKKATADGADAIVLDINTPGGEMFATLDICSLLKNRGETPANLVAWIHPTAYSAGTIIALACREIIVAPASTFGDAAPIDLFGRQMNPTERAKFLSPLLTEIIDSARRNHYDENLLQAFVMLGKELWMIENINTRERVFVDRAEYRSVFGADPPDNVGAVSASAASINTPSTLRPWINTSIPRTSDQSTLDQAQLTRQREFEQTLPPVRQPLTADDGPNWRWLMQVTDGTTLLTLKPDEAVFYGLAEGVVATDRDLRAYFGAQNTIRYDQTWSETLVRFLISWPVRALLIAIFLICLFVELAMPGFGVFGTAAIVALLIVVGAPALAGMAQWWDILLIIVGLLLVATELFILPGFGVPGVVGAICLLVGLVGTFVSGDVTTPAGRDQMWTGFILTLLSVFGAGVIIWLLSRWIHTFPVINRLILHTELKEHDVTGAGQGGLGLLQAMGAAPRTLQIGDSGVAETDLRPAGRAIIDGRMHDVKSVGNYIDKGTPIRVVSVGRFVIEVEEAGA